MLKNHQIITKSTDIDIITKPFLDKHGLNYFQYLKVFKDGAMSLLCNQGKWMEFILEEMQKNDMPVVYSSMPHEERMNKNKYWFFWDHNLPNAPLGLAREFGIYNGLCFAERHKDYYTLTAFATPSTNYGAIDFYVNNIDLLNNYIKQFSLGHKDLIKLSDDNRLTLAKAQQDVNLHAMLLDGNLNSREIIAYNGNTSYITNREKDCLQIIASGKTMKQTGKVLLISPRTVETLLNRVKIRIGLNSKQDLIEFYRNNNF